MTPEFALSPNRLHTAFLSVLPRIETHARITFRFLACAQQKAEAIQESIALAWSWFKRLAERGRDATLFIGALARYAVQAVKSGRRLCGQEPSKDVLSPLAQRRRGFAVERLPASTGRENQQLYGLVRGQQLLDEHEERLHDNTRTPVPDQAAFRLDFPPFLASLSERDRRLASYLALGHSARRAAAEFGLTPGRVTQLRQRWCQAWQRSQEVEASATVRVRDMSHSVAR